MSKADFINILRSHKTVFTFKEILLASQGTSPALLKRRMHYYIKIDQLYPIRRGIYAKDRNFDKYELGTKIYTPAYISFETVLGAAGITFQYYGQIFIASYLSREIVCDDQTYIFRTMKRSLLTNDAGIEHRENYSIATPERAFLDILYLNKDYHFDNLSPLNWKAVYEILTIYGGNKRMARMVAMNHDASKKNLL